MHAGTASGWRGRLRGLLRPEQAGEPPSGRAFAADVLFALAVTAVALLVMARTGTDQAQRVDFGGPIAPVAPVPPGFGDHPDPVHPSWTLTVLTTLPLAFRRRYPLGTFWAVLVAAWALRHGMTWVTVLACLVAGFSAIAHSRYRVHAVASLGIAAVLAGVGYRGTAVSLPDWSAPFFVLLAAGVLAMALRSWRSRLAEIEREQREATRRAVEVERARIAAELHDVVTHNVSVMVIQTGAARKVVDADPELSKKAMLDVEASGRAAMAELRHVMGLLAPSGDGDGEDGGGVPVPQPGLDRLGPLIDRVRATGLRVTADIEPPPGPLPPGVDLTAYRVVQEALTNAMKHAPGASAAVAVRRDGDDLRIEVTDTGGPPGGGLGGAAGTGTGVRTGGGRGLINLRERLAVYGGTLESGRTLGGGFRVAATIPWRTP
ncbi:sensor histidine kinase [Actinomadura verrucosospora]|uniref:histidine kinase n=1 Tax=Actinomadura verrucosospora TaxID=46165 RepID=A0A7D3VXW4_ACTVE|nr:histidine kinase [Actinomadura verrucosospora]QKG21611.1 two-component system sensor kinase [Actinomadura verrucosospora]